MPAQTQQDDFKEMTRFLSAEARHYALDSMACMFHNQGYSLQGNTEHNDVLWLARNLRRILDHEAQWETAHPDRQKELLQIASVAIAALPDLADRIAARYINIAGAMRLISTVAREQTHRLHDGLQKRRGKA